MFAGRGKFSGKEFLLAVTAVRGLRQSTVWAWHVVFSPACVGLTVGENCTGLRSGKRHWTASFLSGGEWGGGGGEFVEMIPCTRLLPYVL